MSRDERSKRLSDIEKLPAIARVDHRLHDIRPTDGMSRNERRILKKGARKISEAYTSLIRDLYSSGAGYPVDQLLRQLAAEFNNRFALSGTETQPISFNYLEPFLKFELLLDSAPAVRVREEVDHLFDLYDFLDYCTSEDTAPPPLSAVKDLLPEGVVHHYSTLGDVEELSTLTADGTPFVVSGFSIVRHGDTAYWYVLAGEVLSDAAWGNAAVPDVEVDPQDIPPDKRGFIAEVISEKPGLGPFLPLEGTAKAARTVLAGATDLTTERHTTRARFTERENAFDVRADDPDLLDDVRPETREELHASMIADIESAGVLWNLAEFLFRLPAYFKFKFTAIKKRTAEDVGKQSSAHVTRAQPSRSFSKFRVISALEVVRQAPPALSAYSPPAYRVEVDGFWRRLSPASFGVGPNGEQVRGRTWVRAHHRWRERPHRPKEVLVKSSVAAARLIATLLDESGVEPNAARANDPAAETLPAHLYVMRCPVMTEEVYKIGWTRRLPAERARELSSQTGVPMAFIVVESWPHEQAAALEKAVHVSLDRYRFNKKREFFALPYESIRKVIVTELGRLK